MRGNQPLGWMLLSLLLAVSGARGVEITVRNGPEHLKNVPVTARLANPRGATSVNLKENGRTVPSQSVADGNGLLVTWLVPELKPNEMRRYSATLARAPAGSSPALVQVETKGGDVEIRIGSALFARYNTTTGPNKPYFHPIFAPGGQRIVRAYPLEEAEGEARDHRHHRGLWFTHGDVNGADFWSEGPNAGKTVHVRTEALESGPIYGGFRAQTDWMTNSGEKIAEDTREFRIYDLGGAYVLDVHIAIRPSGRELVFGDTKEGSFGLRVHEALRVTGEGGRKGEGSILTSEGKRDREAWGTRAAWVTYFGPIGQRVYGVSILDHPSNLRHPTYWHVRDYGLFAANPFGIHDFVRGEPATAGRHVVGQGETFHLRYRVVFHQGDPEAAGISRMWAAYARPPSVVVSSR